MNSGEISLSREIMIVSETNEKGQIIYANEDFCKISGFSKDELIGQPHNIVRDSEMPKSAFQDLWKTIQSGNIWTGIVKNSTKTGGFYWVYATVVPSIDTNGKKRFISIRVKPTVEEITNAKNLYKILR